jgi:hypothetical protein
VEAGDFDGIRDNVEKTLEIIARVRPGGRRPKKR